MGVLGRGVKSILRQERSAAISACFLQNHFRAFSICSFNNRFIQPTLLTRARAQLRVFFNPHSSRSISERFLCSSSSTAAAAVSQQSSVMVDKKAPSSDSAQATKVLDLDRPISDKRLYRHVVLPNKLEALLISDPECDKAAAALNVGVGCVFDPDDVPGLAHFCEHMLFLGTEKYPLEDEYKKYLQQHNGYCNASTNELDTVYRFTVSPEGLDGALDRFSQQFVCPLFTRSATDRELEAVNSEHCKNLRTDGDRHSYYLIKHLSNPNHPYRHFCTGNHSTLRDIPKEKGMDIRQLLLDFYAKYYSANVMRLAVLGRDSLDELERMVRGGRFDAVKNTDVCIPQCEEIGAPEVPYREQDLKKFVKSVPVRDTRTISFNWALPEQTKKWETKPTRYLSHLLGHEGKGSLLSALKAEGLATELTAGPYVDFAGVCLFHVDIQLSEGTADDPKRIDRIVELVHEYIKLLSKNTIQEWLLDELEQLAGLQFKFLSVSSPEDHVVTLADNMHHFPPLRLLSGKYLSWKRDLEEVKTMIDYLTPNRMLIHLTSKSFETPAEKEKWEKEPWFQTPYKVEPFAGIRRKLEQQDDSKRVESAATLDFPKPNPFIPRDLKLKNRPTSKELMPKYPQLLQNYKFPDMFPSLVFFKQDETFDLPKVSVMLRYSCDLPRQDLKGLSLAEVYLLTVKQLINELAYDAKVAGLHYCVRANVDSSFSGDMGGFEVQVAGYNDRMLVLADTLCKAIRKPELKRDAFDVAKTILCRELKIMANNKQPFQQAGQLRNKYMQIPQYLPSERLAVVDSITYEDICELDKSNALLQGLSVEALIQGNITEAEAGKLLTVTSKTLSERLNINKNGNSQQPAQKQQQPKIVDLRDGDKLVRICAKQLAADPEDTNNAVSLSIQLGPCIPEDGAFLAIARTYLHQPFFNLLRTKQQLGYFVNCNTGRSLHCDHLTFVVQSVLLKPEALSQRVEAFLEAYLTKPEEFLSEEEFAKLKQATISALEEKPKRIGEEANRNYSEIICRRFYFNRREKQIEFLRSATRDQFIKYIKTNLYQAPWFNVEIASHKDPIPQPVTETPNVSGKSIPLKPLNPIEWKDAGEYGDKFLSSYAKAFFEFPLPGGQQDANRLIN